MKHASARIIAGSVLAVLAGFAGPAFANSEVDKRAANPNEWGAPGRDNRMTRHSPLADITTANVGKLQMAWSQSTGALRGHEGQPVVIEDVGGLSLIHI